MSWGRLWTSSSKTNVVDTVMMKTVPRDVIQRKGTILVSDVILDAKAAQLLAPGYWKLKLPLTYMSRPLRWLDCCDLCLKLLFDSNCVSPCPADTGWVRDCTGSPVSPVEQVQVTWSKSTNEGVEWVLLASGAKWARIANLLPISEREGRLDRQSGSL